MNLIKIFLYNFVLLQALYSEIYHDRLKLYIDNFHQDFSINISGQLSNNAELNSTMSNYEVIKIDYWLPNARKKDRDGDIYLNRFFIIYFNKINHNINKAYKDFNFLECVGSVEYVNVIKTNYTPNDPYWDQQWGLEAIDASSAYDLWNIDAENIPGQMDTGQMVVGIPDIGYQWDHPDLVDNVWQNIGEDVDGDGVVITYSGGSWIFDPDDVNGIDDDGDGYVDNFIGWDVAFGNNDPSPQNDAFNHGTLVGGCVGSSTNNGIGIASVGWSVKLMGINASTNSETVTDDGPGVLAAAHMGADIINMSWGSYGDCSPSYQNLLNVLFNDYDVILVAGSGNGGVNGHTNFDNMTPSSCENVISVSAVDPGDSFGCWATAGPTVDLCAPGRNIITTDVQGGYNTVLGTSFSSPITSGAIALLWSKFPAMDKQAVIDKIIGSTDQFEDMDGTCFGNSLSGMLGSGRLNINKAIRSEIYPNLYIQNVDHLDDSDGDGIFNPGETIKIKIEVGNDEGWSIAENVIITLSTEDNRIIILDSTIHLTNNIPPGESVYTHVDYFLIQALNDVELGEVPLNIQFHAGNEPPFYFNDTEIDLSISLDQAGFNFPIDGMVLKSSPIIADLDGNYIAEVLVGGDDGNFFGFMAGGESLPGFPFLTGDKIRSSAAIGDVDNDGNNDVVFGSYDGNLYILNSAGTQELSYPQNGYIVGSPALADLDNDGDLEIVFTTQRGVSYGDLYAIHHDGSNMDGFPTGIGERIMVGAAIGDLEADGEKDIVVCTWDDKIYALDRNGNIKPGFPFLSTNRFNSPPTLIDIDNDGKLEIVVGNDSGLLHILHHDGNEMARFDTADDIRGGISVSDINNDGSYEILFTGYDDLLHILDPLEMQELQGWPVDLDANSLSEPITADLDNDGDLEIIGANKNGKIFVFHHDGTSYNHFPIILSGNIESTPAVGDMDNDGDYEIAIATTMGLKVIDLKTELGPTISWKIHRGNTYRTGSFGLTTLSFDDKEKVLPNKFIVKANYPNPFNPTTQIRYNLPEDKFVNITIYDLLGRKVRSLMNDSQIMGYYTITWDAKNDMGEGVSAGMYIYTIQAGEFRATKKMVLLK